MNRPDPERSTYRYPDDWPAIVEEIRQRAGGRCECAGECGNPWCPSGQDPERRCKVQEVRHFPRFQVVALDRNPMNSGSIGRRQNLRAFCESCADSWLFGFQHKPAGDRGDRERPSSPGQGRAGRAAPLELGL